MNDHAPPTTSDRPTAAQLRARAQAIGDAITELLIAFAASAHADQPGASNAKGTPVSLSNPERRRAWTTYEVAEKIGQPYRTVMRLIATGQLRAVKPGKSYSVPDEALKEYLAGRDIETTG
ncbi:excisionase family DNA-binding protein [Amycolatopsis eburnea]|uniref:Helix-turn-helix domain-containing protein n=1 Tax=Amycolatopsis eburnea TaxID=2267691 RepID=A0A3R9FBV7_9PSEU|nr:helix-turn-helix domain-containing protein [Amycolatopsis eburnea]